LALTGGEAAAEAMKQIRPGVVPVYPITPQTPIIEKFIDYVSKKEVDSEVINCESEHSVMSASIGAAAAGVRSMTATSSQGLALMYEMLGIASGMRLPIVMNVSSRALSAPINIHCDHSDVMGVRDAGWIQIYSESAQEVYDHNFLALKLAENEEVFLPAMVLQDGFLTSHLLERVEIIPPLEAEEFVGTYKYPFSLLEEKRKMTFGPLALPDKFFEIKVEQNKAMEKAKEIYKKVATSLSRLTHREYPEIELFGMDEKTEGVIILTGSSAGTAKEVAENLRKKGHLVGVIKIRLFRPFPREELGEALKKVKNIAVLDRTFSFGSVPPLFSEVASTVFCSELTGKKIQSYVYGLGGRELREKNIEEVYADILGDNFSWETRFLNLN